MKKVFLSVMVCFCALHGSTQASLRDTIELKGSSMNKSITFEVAKGTPKMDYALKGILETGQVYAVLTDPEGRRQAGFQLYIQGRGMPQGGKGQESKTISFPFPGTWKLQIRAVDATGSFSYKIHFNSL